MAFYKWRERDLTEIMAYELEEGDEIAYGYGGDLKYGTIPIESVTKVRGSGEVFLQYRLPIGAIAQSSPTNSIAVYWNGKNADIHISQTSTHS